MRAQVVCGHYELDSVLQLEPIMRDHSVSAMVKLVSAQLSMSYIPPNNVVSVISSVTPIPDLLIGFSISCSTSSSRSVCSKTRFSRADWNERRGSLLESRYHGALCSVREEQIVQACFIPSQGHCMSYPFGNPGFCLTQYVLVVFLWTCVV